MTAAITINHDDLYYQMIYIVPLPFQLAVLLQTPSCQILTDLTVMPRAFPAAQVGYQSDKAKSIDQRPNRTSET
jgi:hypothetical protein